MTWVRAHVAAEGSSVSVSPVGEYSASRIGSPRAKSFCMVVSMQKIAAIDQPRSRPRPSPRAEMHSVMIAARRMRES